MNETKFTSILILQILSHQIPSQINIFSMINRYCNHYFTHTTRYLKLSNDCGELSFLEKYALSELDMTCIGNYSKIDVQSVIGQCGSLRGLKVGHSSSFPAELFGWFSSLNGLTHLELHGIRHLNGQLQFVSRLRELRSLTLLRCWDVMDGFSWLKECENLRELRLSVYSSRTDISDVFLVSGLRKLDLESNVIVTDLGIEKLVNLTDLKLAHFKVDIWQRVDIGMEALSLLVNLNSLHLKKYYLTDRGIPHLSKLVNLKSLIIEDCKRVTEKGLDCLSTLHNLKTIKLT
eukprot:TRINITY_DN12272_c0_g1_i1.p1 TRINITY_DN12272_c0_g1~~TRINITY_DN12272_c0_g1_i1.p1  ORF type:complete len:304 (+),score=53.23 TRINITY_DN12272_c0_g1_i1:43-912(+)